MLRERRAGGAPGAWIALAVLALATALALHALRLQRGHSLERTGRWISGKAALERGVLGGVAYWITRTALHRNRLDLGAWHGFQEILSRDALAAAQLGLSLRVEDSARLAVLFRVDDAGFSAVRLSSGGDRPSACLTGRPDGAFTTKRALPATPVRPGWHRLSLWESEGEIAVSLDGRTLGRCPLHAPGPGRVGFRSGGIGITRVDDVQVRDAAGRALLRESFAPTWRSRGNWRDGRGPALLWLAIGLALAGVYALARRSGEARPELAALSAGLVVALAAAGAFTLDFAALGGLHPRRIDYGDVPRNLERPKLAIARLRERAREARPEGVWRILLIGSSQTWGAGARRGEETFARLLEARLGGSAAGGRRIEVINAGLSGTRAAELARRYASEWLALRPDVTVVNLGNNDAETDPETYAQALGRFAELGRARGIRTVFVPEPNSPDPGPHLRALEAKHAVMRRVAREQDVPWIEVHDALARRADEGFLWWDAVHLTSFGHRLMAERLAEHRALLLDDPPGRGDGVW